MLKAATARIAQFAGQPAIATAETFVASVVHFDRTAEAARLVGTDQIVERTAEVLRSWWDAQGLTKMAGYAQETAGVYSRIYYPDVATTLRAQGFEFTD